MSVPARFGDVARRRYAATRSTGESCRVHFFTPRCVLRPRTARSGQCRSIEELHEALPPHADVGAFTYTAEYKELLEVLDLGWWDGRAWLGRLFSMDHDVGEHWMDNESLVEARADLAVRAGLDPDLLMMPDPERMADGRDGPCNTTAFRMRFWTEVVACLVLSDQLIIDSARALHGRCSSAEEIAELEERIAAWQQKRAMR